MDMDIVMDMAMALVMGMVDMEDISMESDHHRRSLRTISAKERLTRTQDMDLVMDMAMDLVRMVLGMAMVMAMDMAMAMDMERDLLKTSNGHSNICLLEDQLIFLDLVMDMDMATDTMVMAIIMAIMVIMDIMVIIMVIISSVCAKMHGYLTNLLTVYPVP